MKGVNISHSKVKNSGILFEVLVRQITTDVLNGQTISPALGILQKYFNVNKELGKELQLYQSFFNTNKLTETRATQFLEMILDQYKKLDQKTLLKEKYELVKEMKESYDLNDILSCKIPSYKIYASIYKTFLAESKINENSIINIQDVASARFSLIEFLIRNRNVEQKESVLLEEFKNQTEDLRLLTYKILIDKFNEKYQDLNDKQKDLLREYINDISSRNTLLNYIKKEVPILKENIELHSKNINDRVIQIKLHEVTSQLDTIGKNKFVKDHEVTSLMIAYQILRELEQHDR